MTTDPKKIQELKDKAAAARAARVRPPRGPSGTPAIPVGHELSGVSTLTGPDGEVRATWEKTRVAGAEPEPLPEGFDAPSRIAQLTRGDGTVVSEWRTYDRAKAEADAAMLDAWRRHADLYAGLAPVTPPPERTNADLCTLYPLGDPHIGMLSWAPETGTNNDTTIACRELLACVGELVASAPASERAIVTNLGDFLHAQDDAALTPGHHNKLDTDSRYAKILDAGHALLRGIVDLALAKHRHVMVRNLPGNHDPRVAVELMYWLKAVYENEPRVTVADAFAVHQYDRFGANLFGWHHGDRTPGRELPAIMAVDRAADWGETRFRLWLCGHVHHMSRDKEHPGCDVETFGILPPGDAWHAGRYRSRRRLHALTMHRDFGEVARATVGIERVRAALARTE